MRTRVFTAPNGKKAVFSFREGTNDESTIIACFEEDYYEILKQDFQPGDVLVDLGAHIGAVTVLMAMVPGVKVVAVEALPENYQILVKNISMNLSFHLVREISTYQRAAWNKDNILLPMYYGDESTENGRVHHYMGNYSSKVGKSVEVQTVSLKKLFETENIEKCRFLKIDIEGAEDKVLGGAPKSVLRRIDTIRGEYHSGDYHRLLDSLGRLEDITPDAMNPIKGSLTEFVWRKNAGK